MSVLDALFGKDVRHSPGLSEAGAGSTETETVRKITEALDQLEPERARYIACYAYLLGRVAHADLEISDEETRAMERIVVERGQLPEEQAIIVVQMAKTQNRLFGGTEDFLVTREFNEVATREQKLALLDCLFAVSASDQGISTVEANEISKIAKAIHLSHEDLVQMRTAYQEYLNVLKKPPGSAAPTE
ncbi:MAG: TerB family tellurite resistance protein [Acidobacteriota bacterium]